MPDIDWKLLHQFDWSDHRRHVLIWIGGFKGATIAFWSIPAHRWIAEDWQAEIEKELPTHFAELDPPVAGATANAA